MLYAGLDLSRKRLDFHLLDDDGATVDVGSAPPDADGLHGLTRRLAPFIDSIRAAIESMNGARFVHDRLELAGWQVLRTSACPVAANVPRPPTPAVLTSRSSRPPWRRSRLSRARASVLGGRVERERRRGRLQHRR